jgi:hypothetical protein
MLSDAARTLNHAPMFFLLSKRSYVGSVIRERVTRIYIFHFQRKSDHLVWEELVEGIFLNLVPHHGFLATPRSLT